MKKIILHLDFLYSFRYNKQGGLNLARLYKETMGKYLMKRTKTGIKFDLKAGNGEVIATSEVYTTERACRAGIASVQKNAPIAAVEDQTAENYKTENI